MAVGQVIVTGDSWVTVGENTTLSCTVDQPYSGLEWKVSYVGITDVFEANLIVTWLAGNVYYNPSIDLNHYVFDNSQGNNALTVRYVNLDDDGKYWWQVILVAGEHPVGFHYINIRGEC